MKITPLTRALVITSLALYVWMIVTVFLFFTQGGAMIGSPAVLVMFVLGVLALYRGVVLVWLNNHYSDVIASLRKEGSNLLAATLPEKTYSYQVWQTLGGGIIILGYMLYWFITQGL